MVSEIWLYENHDKTREKTYFQKPRKKQWKTINCQKTTTKTILSEEYKLLAKAAAAIAVFSLIWYGCEPLSSSLSPVAW